MGRITLFSIDDCPFCFKAKTLLKEKGIEYYEINLSDYPQQRSAMLTLTQQLTVPQIFINKKHIGGASDLLAMNDAGDFDKEWAANKEEEVQLDEKLQRPDCEPAVRPLASPRKVEVLKLKEKGEDVEVGIVDHVTLLETQLGSQFHFKDYETLMAYRYNTDNKTAKALVTSLIEDFGVLKYKHGHTSDPLVLIKSENVFCLNSYRNWSDRVDDPLLVVNNLKKQLGKLNNKHRDKDGLVDYIAVGEDPEFNTFDEATCELQKISLNYLDYETKLAFSINLYNIIILHAFAKVGEARSSYDRYMYFDEVGYNIGGDFYSMNDLENGILRCNRVAPYHWNKQIAPKNERMKAVIPEEKMDGRIHFALNCGAKSCPPVKKFTREAVKEELRIVAMSFMMQEENCKIDVQEKTLTVSQILNWYREDFGRSDQELATTVFGFLTEERQMQLKSIMTSGRFKVLFAPYDWTTDGGNVKIYKRKKGGMCTIC